MITKKSSYFILLSFLFSPIVIIAADCPIIFVHGIQSDSRPVIGWPTWSSSHSAMMKIVNSGYGNYQAGVPLECDKNSTLQSMPDSRRIYNFSYYNPDGTPGVIGSDGRYYPTAYRMEYALNEGYACWAEHLADFIDKVLAAAETDKVDIVAHSMGGVVTRAATTYYGCGDKVRKIITVGTPHDEFDLNLFIETLISEYAFNEFQEKGSLLEMGINYKTLSGNVMFEDVYNPGIEKSYLDWLLENDPQVPIACIAGNNPPGWTEIFGNNDGLVRVPKAHLGYTELNPTIYAMHARPWTTYDDGAITSCAFTTEFIKKWIIDDEVLPNSPVPNNFNVRPGIVVQHEQYLDFCSPGLSSWGPVLSTSVRVYNSIGQSVTHLVGKGIGWHSTEGMNTCFYPVLCTSPGVFPANAKYTVKFVHQNMQIGDFVNGEEEITVSDHGGDPASVNFDLQSIFYFGQKLNLGVGLIINAWSPTAIIERGYTGIMLDTTYFYKYTTDTDYQECVLDADGCWTVPAPPPPISGPVQYNVKAVVNLDPITTLSDETTITVPFDIVAINERITNMRSFYAINSVTAAYYGYFIIAVDVIEEHVHQGRVTMGAGDHINLLPGFEAQEGCYFHSYIDPTLKGESPILSFYMVQDSALNITPELSKIKKEDSTNTSVELSSIETKEDIPKVFSCAQNYPNPFATSTTIKYGLPKNVQVQLDIYNLMGQKVRILVNAKQTAGYKVIEWDGQTSAGTPAPKGIYFYTFKAGDYIKHRKMILVK